jgi:hypothetical protein
MMQVDGSATVENAPGRFLRSVRLDQDLLIRGALTAYMVTPQVQELLRRFARALDPQSTDRAWTVTGPYGTGKSAYALFLARLVDRGLADGGAAWSLLRSQAPSVAKELEESLGDGPSLFPVVLTLRRASVARSLGEALLASLDRLPASSEREALASDLRTELQSGVLDTRRLLARVKRLAKLADGFGHYRGVLIIFDELGKALEHAARHEGDDIYVLQELAETAQRSNHHPLFVVGILHQSFDNYAAPLDSLTRNEWGKVQGRFTDVAFLEPAEQLIRLAGRAVGQLASGSCLSAGLQSIAEAVAVELAVHGLAPRHMHPDEFRAVAASAVPLHPLTLVALPYLFRRLAQNERSLFAYLASQEPFGVRDLVQTGDGRLIRLADLYDYCSANVGGLLAGQVVSRHWLEIGDAIDRSPDLSEFQVQIVKSVGLLGILGEFSHLKPSPEAVGLAVDDAAFSERARAALEELRVRSLLNFRRFDGTYRIWEGSDIDVDDRLSEARRRTGRQHELAATLNRYLPPRPIVARRHSYESGAVRYFEVQYLEALDSPSSIRPEGAADGVVALCLSGHQAGAEAFRQWAGDRSLAWPANLVIVVPQHLRGLREATSELRALNWVWENTPELRDDRVARRELSERTIAAEQSLMSLVDSLLDPRPEPLGNLAAWYHRGKQIDAGSLTAAKQFLSTVMDEQFCASPRIHNELVNRRVLSSAAAAARRTLIERMLGQSSQPLLGMSGYPPERSMYESVLLDSGLHREEDSVWTFEPPRSDDPRNLLPVWNELQRAIFQPTSDPIPVDQLFARLMSPPYGVTAGVLPVLLAAFLLANLDEMSLYREGRFVSEPAIADFEVLMRRPELFAVAGSRVEGERAAVVERLARSLNVRPSMVPVVRALVRGVRSLPDSAWRTRRLSPAATALRRAYEQAGSPERLLFREIPEAVGCQPFTDDGVVDRERIGAFFDELNTVLVEWSQFAPRQIMWARDVLLKECGLSTDEEGWRHLLERARVLADEPIHASLVPFVRRLAALGDDRTILESVLALVAGKPPKSWLDADVDQYPTRAREFGERFRYAYEALAPLSPDEQADVAQLLVRLRGDVTGSGSRRVARSALATLLAELSSDPGGNN